ncbi:MAG: hypothetical protein QM628_00355 [Propionicimonas sp.]
MTCERTTKMIATRAFEDGFREGVFARNLHHQIKHAEDAIRGAWFLTAWSGVLLLLTALRIAVEPSLIQWIALVVMAGGTGFGGYGVWWSKREHRRAIAAMDAWKSKWRAQ